MHSSVGLACCPPVAPMMADCSQGQDGGKLPCDLVRSSKMEMRCHALPGPCTTSSAPCHPASTSRSMHSHPAPAPPPHGGQMCRRPVQSAGTCVRVEGAGDPLEWCQQPRRLPPSSQPPRPNQPLRASPPPVASAPEEEGGNGEGAAGAGHQEAGQARVICGLVPQRLQSTIVTGCHTGVDPPASRGEATALGTSVPQPAAWLWGKRATLDPPHHTLSHEPQR